MLFRSTQSIHSLRANLLVVLETCTTRRQPSLAFQHVDQGAADRRHLPNQPELPCLLVEEEASRQVGRYLIRSSDLLFLPLPTRTEPGRVGG